MDAGDIQELCMPDCRGDFNKIRQWLGGEIDYIKGKTDKQIFGIVILQKENDYSKVKGIFSEHNMLTQFIRKFTAKKMNLSVASNIMKQVNSKIGGESIRIKLPKFMEEEHVMVIGIDVCHAGKKSIVGFVASTNSSCTSVYSDIVI